jgi:hypothetical protein
MELKTGLGYEPQSVGYSLVPYMLYQNGIVCSDLDNPGNEHIFCAIAGYQFV